MFVEKGHSTKVLEKVTKECINNINCRKERENRQLTKKNCKTTMSTDTWAKIKKIILKVGIRTIFYSKRNLKTFIYKIKSKLHPNSFVSVCQLEPYA